MKLVLATLSVAFVFAATLARADVPPPNSDQCRSLKAGDACTLEEGGPGHCEDQTCARARPDGSSEYPCRICVPGAPAAATATEAPAAPAQKSSCAGGGAESLLALGAAVALVARRVSRT